MKTIIVKGLASGRMVAEIKVEANSTADKISLMDFLMKHKIPVASSCGGAGTCKKCVVNGDLLSCQITLKDFIQDKQTAVVEFTYL